MNAIPAGETVTVTFFTDHAATTKREQSLSLEALAERIHTTAASDKASLPWRKLARFGERRSEKNSLRHDDNVATITGIEADYDHMEMSLAEAKDILARADITAILYPSPSYTDQKPKWRVLCPFSEEHPPAARDHFMARLNGLFGGIFSRESWALSQSYYYGRVANLDHHVTVFEGTPIDLADHLDAGAIGRPKERNVGQKAQPTQKPADIAEARIRGLVTALLDNILAAKDGEKHHTLRDTCLTLGGYLHLVGWSVHEAVEQAIGALPSADDWDKARDTARWAIKRGMERPLTIEERPNPHQRRSDGADAPPSEWEAQHPSAEPQTQSWPEPVDCFVDFGSAPAIVTEDEAPPALWPFIKDTAERMGVATSSVMLCSTVSCSAVISEQWRIQPKRRDWSWSETSILWGAMVGPPAIGKTPVIRVCTQPIEAMEREERKKWQEQYDVWKVEHDAWKEAKKHKDDDPGEEPQRPRCNRNLVESFTMEALQEVLRDDDAAKFACPAGKVLCRQHELSELVANLDRYHSGRSGGDRSALLRLNDGGPYSVDRVIRGSFFSPSWAAAVLGGIQPEPIQAIAKQSADDGLLQRFCYDVPHPDQMIGDDHPPNRDAIQRYQQLFPALAALRPARTSEEHDQTVIFHADAHASRERIDDLARLMAALPDTSTRLQSALGKWRGLFARLCLTFHLIGIADVRARNETAPPLMIVSTATAERVERYMRRILLPHLLRADAIMFSTAQTNHAKWIAGHILAHHLDRIAARDLRGYRPLSAPEARDELSSVMASLVAIGWLDPEPPRNQFAPVSAWRVNPLVHERFAARAAQERAERQQRVEEVRQKLKAMS
jgi:hypothetical protein